MRKKPQILDLVMVVAAISWLVEAKLTFRTSNQKSDFRISQTGGNQENIFKVILLLYCGFIFFLIFTESPRIVRIQAVLFLL